MSRELNLVTGGAGFIGSHIAEALLARGERVRILDNFSTGHRGNLAGLERAELVEGDIRDPEACARACAGATWVFHEAALPSVPRSLADPRTTHEVCATGTLHLLMAAREAGVRRFVYAGSSSAYGDTPQLPKSEEMAPDPRSPYAVGKLAGEQYATAFRHSFGLSTVTLRYFNVFGPRQDPSSQYSGVIALFTRKLLAGEECTIFGDGETSRDFTYVGNVVEANLLARDRPSVSGIYNVGADARTTLTELYQAIARQLGSRRAPVYAAERPGDIRHSLADLTAARRDLGYEPRTDLERGLATTIAWQRAQKDASAGAGRG